MARTSIRNVASGLSAGGCARRKAFSTPASASPSSRSSSHEEYCRVVRLKNSCGNFRTDPARATTCNAASSRGKV